jgi:ApbE superfamily uncharacterized protein (UPF0280 family)
MTYLQRTYRNKLFNQILHSFNVTHRETDLFIFADSSLISLAYDAVYKYRDQIESYIQHHPAFLISLNPLDQDHFAPKIVREMLKAAEMAHVGPMAAVAGAIAEYVGQDILQQSENVIVENGGDIFIKTKEEVIIEIFAGESPLSSKIRIRIKPDQMPIGVCTSSGTVGHSLSFGSADAVCVLSSSAAVADASATAIGNYVKDKRDIKNALEWGGQIKEVIGVLIIAGDRMGIRGSIELVY